MVNHRQDRILYQIDNKKKENLYDRFLENYLTASEIIEYTDELFNNKYWWELHEKRKEKRKEYDNSDLGMFSGTLQILYCIIRKYKPSVVVETGVHYGSSSWVFICALIKNKKGKLTSIDDWNHEDCGYFVPKKFRPRWDLRIGKSKDVLPKLKLKKIDIFCHDSEHSYENQAFEYQWAIKKVVDNGFIISHDIGASNAWFEFVKKNNLEWYFLKTATKSYATGIAKVNRIGI